MSFCLLPDKINEFKQALKDRDIKMEDLFKMSTDELTNTFKEYAGDNAGDIALLFEQKRILKNKLQGIKNAVSKIGEIGRYDPAKKAQIQQAMEEFKQKQQERIFNPKEGEAFLGALADKIIGTHITEEQSKTFFNLQKKAYDLKKNFDTTKSIKERTPEEQQSAHEYGAAQVVSNKFIQAIQGDTMAIKDLLRGASQEIQQQWKEGKIKTIGDTLMKTIKTISDTSISMVASFDDSFIGRQGLKTLMTHPTDWLPMAKASFQDIYSTLGGKDSRDALWADILSDPDYMNGEYTKAGLIPKTEEQFPTSLFGKVPGLGRIFRAAENAFTGSAIRSRVALYKRLKKNAISYEVKWDDTQIKDNGTLINALTARGKVGQVGSSAPVRLVMWAPRMLKANWDVLTMHTGGYGLETTFTRKEAALNLTKIVGETAVLIMIANALKPGSAETDPRSSNFGKIKVGNTSFDYTGGAASLITLASRIVTNSSKSAITGVVSSFGSGYGETSRWDALLNFLEGKVTPPVRVVMSWMQGKNMTGQKPTLGSATYGALIPIPLQNAIQLKDDHSAEAVLGVILDGIGINANTSQMGKTDWEQSSTVELLQFKEKVGIDRFKEANNLYNQKVNEWLNSIKINTEFSKLTDDEKQSVITKKKGEIKNNIFRDYGFKYKAPPKAKTPNF